jgi:phospholipid-binding lipoprotein MlaA
LRLTPLVPRLARALCVLGVLAALGACAGQPPSTHPSDPLEDLNRANFALDQKAEHVVIQPVAHVYVRAVPKPVRIVVHNFFSNLRDPLVVVNELLEGRWRESGEELARFAVNTTFGILGAFDVASAMGLHRHHADAGLTLAHWGLPEGPYLVLPLLGPTTLRGAFGKGFDAALDPIDYDPYVPSRNALTLLQEVDTGAQIRTIERLLSQSFDPYVMARQAYMAHRRYRYYHGNPPVHFPTPGSGGGFPPPAGGGPPAKGPMGVLRRAVADVYPVFGPARTPAVVGRIRGSR